MHKEGTSNIMEKCKRTNNIRNLCDTKGLPIYVDGHLVDISLKNPIDVLPGWHKVGYFPNDYTKDNNVLIKEKIMMIF